MEAPAETQVIVVGAGPVGLMLAGELRLGGADVVVVERLSAPTTESRASTLHARTMELFGGRGLLEAIGTPPKVGMGHFGGIPLDFGGLPSAYPGQWKVPQTRTEEVLYEWASGLGADIRRGHELRALTPHADHVAADIAGPDGPVRMRAAYVVGCDGENSTVRRLAGFDFPGTDAGRELLRADVVGIDVPDRRFERRPKGLAIAGRLGDGVTRIMVHEYGRLTVPRARDPEFAEVISWWARVTGEDISHGTAIWANAFGDASRQVTRYRQGRVLLAGDAAHVQLPAGGQALNLGLQDAVNLGWKLAAHLRGQAPAGLLDSYHDERHAVGARVLTNIQAQALILLGGVEVEALRAVLGELLGFDAVCGHLTGMISGLDVRYPVDPDDHPLLGRRMPYADLMAPEPAGVTAALRSARGVLLDLSGDGVARAELTGTVAGWADRVDLVTAEAKPDSDLARLEAVLVRPDGHIVWASTDGAAAALHRWFGVPAAAAAPA